MEEGVINPKDTKADVSKHSEQYNGKENENSSKDFPESTSSHDDDVHIVDESPFKNEQVCFSIPKTVRSYIGMQAHVQCFGCLGSNFNRTTCTEGNAKDE